MGRRSIAINCETSLGTSIAVVLEEVIAMIIPPGSSLVCQQKTLLELVDAARDCQSGFGGKLANQFARTGIHHFDYCSLGVGVYTEFQALVRLLHGQIEGRYCAFQHFHGRLRGWLRRRRDDRFYWRNAIGP